MSERDILKELLRLSQGLLKATIEEDWMAWEGLKKQQLILYKTLERESAEIFDPKGKEVLQEIKTLDDRIMEELLKKREETRQALLQMKSTGKGWKSYGERVKSRPGHHFNIDC